MTMTQEEIEAFLSEPRLCHFATVDADGRPRVRPIWFLWQDGAFYFTTRLQARHTGRDVVDGSPVTLSIASDDRPYRAVIAHGRPEVLAKHPDLLLAISTRYGDREGRSWTTGALKEPDRVALKLVPEEVLSWNYGRGDYGRQTKGLSMRTTLAAAEEPGGPGSSTPG